MWRLIETGHRRQRIVGAKRIRAPMSGSLWLFALAMTALSVIVAPAAAIAAGRETPISTAYCIDCVPFQFQDENGEPAGLIIDLWRLWSEKTGIEIDFRPGRWGETLRMVRDGEAEAHAGLFYNEQRARYLEYGTYLTSTETHVFIKKGLLPIAAVEDLAAFRVGVLAGDYVEGFLKEKLPEGTIVGYESYDAIMDALRDGQLQVFAADSPTGIYHLQKAGLGFDFEYPKSKPLYETDWRAATTKGNTDLILIINQGLALITQAERREIERRWVAVEAKGFELSRRDIAILAIILAVLVVAGVVVWTVSLKRQISLQTRELRVANQASAAAQTRLLDAINRLPAAFVLYDSEDRLLLCNGRYRDLYGYSEEETAVGVEHGALYELDVERGNIAADMDAEEYFQRIVSRRRGREGIVEVQFANHRWLEIHEHPTSDGGLVSIQVDITDRKAAEEALREARDEADQANRAKSSFLATMSHEIRTPMTGVIGMVDLLRQTRLDEDQRQMMTTVRESAYSLLVIINDILDFSKIEAGKLEIEAIPVSICDVVEGVGETLAANARTKDVGLSIYVDPDIPDAVLGDQTRLRQILFNLGGNAVKFTDKGKVLVRADRMPSRVKKSVTIRFQVIDTGIGIPKSARKALFEAFTQADASTARRFGGTGLGLSICERLTKMMKGSIEVESRPGKGSTFTVTIPFPVAEDHAVKSDGLDLSGLNVLMALQDSDMRELVPRYLRHWNAKVITTGQLGRVRRLLRHAAGRSEPFDVVVIGSGWPFDERAHAIESIHGEEDLAHTRFVLCARIRMKTDRKELAKTVYVDSDPLRRGRLLRAVAVAAGRASPDLQYDEDGLALEASKAPSVEEALAEERLILFAEDLPTNQQVLLRQLNMLGYAADMVPDGVAALAALREKNYAVLLTDCHMPNMDGFELTASIRKQEGKGRRLPIIAITATALAGEAERCLAAGMDDYLSKPVELITLKRILKKWMPARTDEGASAAEPIDIKALAGLVGDDAAFIIEMLDSFVRDNHKAHEQLSKAIEAHSASEVETAAHKLAGMGRIIGALTLAALGQSLQTAGSEENWPEVERLLPGVEEASRAAIAFVDGYKADVS